MNPQKMEGKSPLCSAFQDENSSIMYILDNHYHQSQSSHIDYDPIQVALEEICQ